MSFLKAFWKNQGKHRKLGDEWALAKDQEGDLEYLPQSENNSENDTFKVKYLGRTPLVLPTNQLTTSTAINTILAVAKANRKKAQRVNVTLSMKGIEVIDISSQKTVLDISIFRISNCSADSMHNRVFAFLATNSYETTECHAFLCPKRGIAEQMAITVAKSFNAVYEAWQEKQRFTMDSRIDDKTNHLKSNYSCNDFNTTNKQDNNQNLRNDNITLIDISENYKENKWVSFENEQEELPRRLYQNLNKPAITFIQNNSINGNCFNDNAEWKERNTIDLFAV